MKSGKKTSAKRFLIIFLLTVAGLAIISQLLYSFYIKLFNEGMITDVQTLLLASATLAASIGLTAVVGIRYVWHIKSHKRIKV